MPDLTIEQREARLMHFARQLTGSGRITAELMRKTDALTRKDIASWRRAWQVAISVDNPRRLALYDIYSDALVDGHITGCIEQRKSKTLSRPFKLTDKDGTEHPEASAIFEREWFHDFLDLALDAIFWGHSLIEMGEVIKDEEGMRFASVKIIPRKHVIPEYGLVLRDPTDDLKKGITYREGDFSRWVVEVGKPHNLGLLLKCSPSYISKKNMGGYWDTFGEIFGMPMRVANTSTTNQAELDNIERIMEQMGAASYGVFPEGTTISFEETSRGDAYNVYDKRLERCDKELSKIILNQTMTIDDGSSLSQSEVHLEIFETVCASDARRLAYIINDRLLPLMVSFGFPLQGLNFEWDYSDEMTDAEMREEERTILQYYRIDPAYFADKYGIPIIGERNGGDDQPPKETEEEKEKKLSRGDDFFA